MDHKYNGLRSIVHGPIKIKTPIPTMGRTLLCIRGATQLRLINKKSVVMQRNQPHFEGTTIADVYPCPVTGASRLCYSGFRPVSRCGSEDHSPLRSRAGFSARPTCSLERCSTTTIPRHCLVGFADYKQKDLAVNRKIKF